MKIYEQMVKFRYKHLMIRCWIPSDKIDFFNHKEKSIEYNNYLKQILKDLTRQDWKDSIKAGLNYSYISEQLAHKFQMNACEVIDNKTGFGGLYYPEWP